MMKVAKPKKKPVEFLGSSLDDIRDFPETARIEAGSQIRRVQYGDEPDDWKPMPTIGAGVNEIRIRDDGDQYRVIYIAKLAEAVFVLHCFQKKTQKTPKPDLELAKKRLRELLEELKK
jgi:phage-related protein